MFSSCVKRYGDRKRAFWFFFFFFSGYEDEKEQFVQKKEIKLYILYFKISNIITSENIYGF